MTYWHKTCEKLGKITCCMNKYKGISLFWLLVVLLPGCASFGPTIRIETPEPAEDFVVLCEWHKAALIDFHGGGLKRSDWKVFVTESGKEVDCGVSFGGGDGSATIMHPVYAGERACEIGCESPQITESGSVFIVNPNTAEKTLNLLVKKHSGKKILSYIRTYGSIDKEYYKYYRSYQPLDTLRMRKLYDKRLISYWEKLKNIKEKYGEKFVQPKSYLEYYWKVADEVE